jgi:DNA-directed RNA polymerase specialized sigma24 family protein
MQFQEQAKAISFERCGNTNSRDRLPSVGAAYNLARWLTRNEHDAEDVVQEAYLRFSSSSAGFAGATAASGC